ncbi:hypothetical protein LPB03_04445 [Polaribacter vadi]|uniref:Uncharacterized protein n=1 Tax=Polaribacter vadi TaxID=1774273 RepID=A0A1B8TX85_9FLAO|nr:hypothetical protein LPB03_04445 [Polaribacter vadi]OBY64331.1 hypothetical protein LPB3_08050 [Polaribacter vadi]
MLIYFRNKKQQTSNHLPKIKIYNLNKLLGSFYHLFSSFLWIIALQFKRFQFVISKVDENFTQLV